MIVDINIFDPTLIVTRRLPYRQANWNNLKEQKRTGKQRPVDLPSPRGVTPQEEPGESLQTGVFETLT